MASFFSGAFMQFSLFHFFNTAVELPRMAAEMAQFMRHWPKTRDTLPEGDGHPVLVLPGFLTTDHFTSTLRRCIDEKGYKTYAWEGGLNTGFNDRTAQHLRGQLEKIYKENGNRKVSIVGHSLGGIYARELAREFPHMVRCVVTMGSPAGMIGKPGAAAPVVGHLYEMFNPASGHNDLDLQVRGQTPPPVPTTSIYSRQDGIVHWKACLNPATPKAENIAVSGGHLGIVLNVPAIAAVLDRLSQPEGKWKRFDASEYTSGHYGETDPADLPHNPKWSQKKAQSRPMFPNAP
jgi:hypothetical protein